METLDDLQIGSGQFGSVFLRESQNSKMAVKIITVRSDSKKYYKKECEVLEKVSHTNVVSYIGTREIGEIGSNLFEIWMEYCERGSLEKVLFNPQIIYSMKTIVSWMERLFDALDHLFRRHRIVHRDIKPENIFVKEDFTLKIGDFGIAKESETTQEGTNVGTKRYMAPPQISTDYRDDSKGGKEQIFQVCHKNDVYAMGLVFWELVERRLIFSEYTKDGRFDQDLFLLNLFMKDLEEVESLTCRQESLKLIVNSCVDFDRSARSTAFKVVEELKMMLETDKYLQNYDYQPIIDVSQKILLKPIGWDNSKTPAPVKCLANATFTTISTIPSFGSASNTSTSTSTQSNDSDIYSYLRSLKLSRSRAYVVHSEKLFEKFLELPEDQKASLSKSFPRLISEILMETKIFHRYKELQEKADLLTQSSTIPELIKSILYSDLYRQGTWLEDSLFKLETYYNARSFSAKDRFARINSFVKGFEHMKNGKFELYTARFHFQMYFSLDRRKEWLLVNEERKVFVKKDLSQCKTFLGEWKKDGERQYFINRRQVFDRYQEKMIERNEEMRPSGLQPVDLYMVIDAFKRERENIVKLGKFEDEKRVPLETLEHLGELFLNCKVGLRLPIKGYIFQLRNPPRQSCSHQPKCPIIVDSGDQESPPETLIPFYKCTNARAQLYLSDYSNFCDVIGPSLDDKAYKITETSLGYGREYMAHNRIHIIHHSYLCFIQIPNILVKDDDRMLILLDHPRNYQDDEYVPAFDYEMNYCEIPVVELSKYLSSLPPNERTFARIGHHFNFRVIDNNGHLMAPKLLKRTLSIETSTAENNKKSK